MTQLKNFRDVHKILVEDAEHSWILGLLASAIIEDRRIDWEKHFSKHNSRLPNDEEVQGWYEQQTPQVLTDAVADAENALMLFAEDSIQEEAMQIRTEITESVIIQEIRLGRRFLPQFGVNVLGGVISAVIFAAVLVIFTWYIVLDPSPVAMVRESLQAPAQGNTNAQGQENE